MFTRPTHVKQRSVRETLTLGWVLLFRQLMHLPGSGIMS